MTKSGKKAGRECERCKDYSSMGISDSCPSCDLEKEMTDTKDYKAKGFNSASEMRRVEMMRAEDKPCCPNSDHTPLCNLSHAVSTSKDKTSYLYEAAKEVVGEKGQLQKSDENLQQTTGTNKTCDDVAEEKPSHDSEETQNQKTSEQLAEKPSPNEREEAYEKFVENFRKQMGEMAMDLALQAPTTEHAFRIGWESARNQESHPIASAAINEEMKNTLQETYHRLKALRLQVGQKEQNWLTMHLGETLKTIDRTLERSRHLALALTTEEKP